MTVKDSGNSILISQAPRSRNVAAISLLLLSLLFICQLISLQMSKVSTSELDSLPVSIRAESQADYSRNKDALFIPFISENILKQIITDIPATGNPQDRMLTLQASLSMPVPTMTPDNFLTVTFIPTQATIGTLTSSTPAWTPSLIPPRTQTLASVFTSTKTSIPLKTLTPSRTFTPSNTVASTFTRTPTRTFTPSPTFTRTPTATFTTTATSTETSTPSLTMTATTTDTPTITPSPTNTPTPTNTPFCALTSGGMSLSGQEIDMTITNNGGTLVTITSINVNWPDTPASQAITEVKFNGVTIVNSNDPQPPSDYPAENIWTGTQSDRELAASDSRLLKLLFQDNLQPSGYSITITFDNGCVINDSN